ncbi:UDP-glucoronosyl and UDP-glucosyl transferase [Trichostrongylus colubriformis]|uniref:UDP-glucuronosyltransferase n=1 Tax=Trichostrongylus colubriformis TaxID=6319 RepID=A0AAN8G292_TRICO
MIRCWVILLAVSLCSTDAYKFLVYSPIFGYSHTNFMGVIADTLTGAGHDVTVLMPVLDKDEGHKTGLKLTKKIIKPSIIPRVQEMMSYKSDLVSKMWTMTPRLVTDDALLKRLAEEKFDVGIAEAFTFCGLGLFEVLKIPSSIATFSGVYMDIVSKSIGEPITPSYVPGGMATQGERMNIIERLKNAIGVVMGQRFFGNTFVEEIKVFRKKFGPEFRDYDNIIGMVHDASYVFTNSNPYLDFPRPIIHKTISIGGVAVHIDAEKNVLAKEWDSILSERNTTVLVSFGSVAKSIYMPDEYKKTLLKVFESMPETTFIWKYEADGSQIAAHLRNVHLSTWVPQNALLADPRLTAFITHGGLGSVTELAHLGKPAILVPLFADQERNAHMLAKHGGGIVATKYALEHPAVLREFLQKIFNDASYSHNAKRLSEMLLNQPISAKQLLIRHSEFAAKFGR